MSAVRKGLVMKSTGSWYTTRTSDGVMFQCRVRGKLKLKDTKITNPIAVGDWVDFQQDGSDKPEGLILNVYARDNYVIRKSVHKTAHAHIIASNLDQAMIMATMSQPRTSQGFIDRFLVSCESFRIPAIIIFNKVDLLAKREEERMLEMMAMYDNIGYRVLAISALKETGLNTVDELLKGKVTLLAGHSGVGKSTLLNRLDSEISQEVREVSDYTDKGKHTTSFAEMFELDTETYIIDTPGIKELGLIDMELFEISHYFPEMRKSLGHCKFNDCLHVNEPGCVVFNDLESGKIQLQRYQSYLSILNDEDNRR